MSRSWHFRSAAALSLALAVCCVVTAAGEPLEGYAFPLSAAPGEVVSFYVSSPHDYTVRYARYQRQGDQNAAIALTRLRRPDGGRAAGQRAAVAERVRVGRELPDPGPRRTGPRASAPPN